MSPACSAAKYFAEIREDLKPQSLSFTEIAKRVGESWQLLLPEEKERFESQASIDKERYNTEMAKYKKTSKHQEYAAYLADFKLNNAGTLFLDPLQSLFPLDNVFAKTVQMASVQDWSLRVKEV